MFLMKKIIFYFLIFAVALISCENDEKQFTESFTDSNGFHYESVKGDVLNTRIYTLENGLKVYLSVNKDEPRIQTFIAVRAGSNFDPPETTGLAHYFEHMMFKGTDEFGTINWGEEKVYIDRLSELYEEHRNENDPQKKKKIYEKIDSISGIAAQFAVANEYDKMVAAMGAKGSNAGTSNEYTVYLANIPANRFEQWLKLEKERFSGPVLRLFHTELETVYEEYNMTQDNDSRKINHALMSGLFKKHPLGTQTVIGVPDQLKNPSMVNIMNYFDAYYCPNNMAICLSGDLDMDKTVKLINDYFGDFEPNDSIPEFNPPKEDPIKEPVVKTVAGPEAESVHIGFRFEGANSDDEEYVTLIDNILSNSQAGLIDLDLNQQQKVLDAGAYTQFFTDYGMHVFYGKPREGQSLEEVKKLILGEIEKIKEGEFDDWLIPAVVNDLRLSELYQQENNYRAYKYVDAFIKKVNWEDEVQFIDKLEKISKDELVRFARKHYNDNYVIVFKEKGIDTNKVKIEKPEITPVELNREAQSEFLKEFVNEPADKMKPVFIDFKKAIRNTNLKSKARLDYIKNKSNDLFALSYIIKMGKNHLKELPIAINYLKLLGTEEYSPEEIKKEFFRLGIDFDVQTGLTQTVVTISGLNKSFEKGVQLLEHLLANVKADKGIYNEYVEGILKKRSDAKLDKNTILWSALVNYGKYGPISPYTNIFSEKELKIINPEYLTRLVHDLYSYQHNVFYYGPRTLDEVQIILSMYHETPDKLLEYPPEFEFIEQPVTENKVYFVDYDMVQLNIVSMSRDGHFNVKLIPPARLFNEFYGSGFTSIVFQDIREARGLAYTAFANFAIPANKDYSHYIYTYVGTQPDKLSDAHTAMSSLMNQMPEANIQFEAAKDAIITSIETERITKDDIFWTYLANQKRGIDYDIRKDIYEYVRNAGIDKMEDFFDEYIKGKNYIYLVVGNKEDIDMEELGKLGKLEELSLEEIFGY